MEGGGVKGPRGALPPSLFVFTLRALDGRLDHSAVRDSGPGGGRPREEGWLYLERSDIRRGNNWRAAAAAAARKDAAQRRSCAETSADIRPRAHLQAY